jgi:hypothetical protein
VSRSIKNRIDGTKQQHRALEIQALATRLLYLRREAAKAAAKLEAR